MRQVRIHLYPVEGNPQTTLSIHDPDGRCAGRPNYNSTLVERHL